MTAVAPCRDCPNRTPTCHSTCGAYKTWAVEQREAKRNSFDCYYAKQYLPDNIRRYSWDQWKRTTRRGKRVKD